jgi:hypothetical protein
MRLSLFDDSNAPGPEPSSYDTNEIPNATIDAVRVGGSAELTRLLTQVRRAGNGGVAGLLGRAFVLTDLEEDTQRELDGWAADARPGQRASIIAGIRIDEDGGAAVAGISHGEVIALADALAQIASTWPGRYRITPTRYDVHLDLGEEVGDDEDADVEEDDVDDDGDFDAEDDFDEDGDYEDEDEDEQEADEDEPADEAVGAVVALLVLKTST